MAGRTVGNIQVYVDADTSRLKAQIVGGAKIAGAAAKSAIQRELNNIEAELERIDVTPAAQLARRQLEAAFRGIKINPDLDLKKAMAALKAFEQQEVELDAFLNFDKANAQIFGFKQETRADRAQLSVEVEFDRAQMRADLAALEATMGELGLDVDMDLATASAQLAAFRERQEADSIEIDVDVDTDALGASILARMKKIGADSGDGFNVGLSSRMKLIAGAIALLAEPAGVALQGLVGPSLEILSSGFSALAGSAGAALPILAGLGATLTAVGIGFQGMGDAFSTVQEMFGARAIGDTEAAAEAFAKLQEQMRALAPSAGRFVAAFADVYPQFQNIQRAVADELFGGLDRELRSLSRDVIPDVGRSLVAAGTTANRFFKELADAARDIDFEEIFLSIQPALDAMGRGIANVLRAFDPFMKAAAPAARLLAKSFEEAAESLLAMTKAGAGSGRLTKFLIEGVESLKDWWALTRNVGDALFTLFEAGKSGGDGMVRNLADIVGRFDEWMESLEGQNALAKFFEDGRQILSDMVPVLQGLKGLFENLVTPGAVDRFGNLTRSVGEFLPQLGSMLELLGRMEILQTIVDLFGAVGDAIDPVLPQLQEAADAIGVGLGDAVADLAPHIADLAEHFANLVSDLSDNFGPAMGIVADALGLLGDALGVIMDIFGALPDFVQTGVIAFVALNSVLGGLPKLLIGLGSSLLAAGGGIKTIATNLAGLAAAHPILAGVAAGALAIGGAFILSRQHAREAAKEVEGYVDALMEMENGATAAVAVSETLANLRKESDGTREGFVELGFSVGEWAADMVRGTSDASSGMDQILSAIGPVGVALSDMVRRGEISFDELIRGLDNTSSGLTNMDPAILAAAEGFGNLDISGAQVARMLEFVTDQSNRLGLAQEEVALRSAEAGDGLTQFEEDADGAGMGALEAAESARLLEEAERLVESGSISAADALLLMEGASTDAGQAAAGAEGDFTGMAEILANVVDFADPAADALYRLGTEARSTRDAASALREAWDLLLGGTQSVEVATNNLGSGIIELKDRIEEARAGNEGFSLSLDTATEAGIANREAILGQVQNIQDWTEAQKAAGASTTDITTGIGMLRAQLVEQVAAFTGSTESAEAYVSTLLGTPEDIETLVNTPGLADAITNVEDLSTKAGGVPGINMPVEQPGMPEAQTDLQTLTDLGIGVPGVNMNVYAPGLPEAVEGTGQLDENTSAIATAIETAFGMLGLDDALTGTEDLGVAAEDVPDAVSTSFSTPGLANAISNTDTYDESVRGIPASDAVTFTQPGLAVGIANTNAYDDAIRGIPAADAVTFTQPGLATGIFNTNAYDDAIRGIPASDSVSFSTPGLETAIDRVGALRTSIANIPSSKTITFNLRTIGGVPDLAEGGIAPALGAFGGEAGLERAFYPDGTQSLLTSRTYVPSGTLVVPTEQLGSTAATGTVIQKQVNNDVKVYTVVDDAQVVATQVVNRLATSAAI
jgi:hypothetical protein